MLSDSEKRQEYVLKTNVIQQNRQNKNCTFRNSRFTRNTDHNASFANRSFSGEFDKNPNSGHQFTDSAASNRIRFDQYFKPSFEQNSNANVQQQYRKRK